MGELEILHSIAQESIAIATTILLIVLLLRPKDRQLDEKTNALFEKNKQIETLLITNQELAQHTKSMADNVTKLVNDVGSISSTMEKIADEMEVLSTNQAKLKDGQDELWKEVVRLKGER
jgi:uncharacterized protein YoxC